jgi:hypothetical protein
MTTETIMPSYRIIVEGRLDPAWSPSLAGLDIAEDDASSFRPTSVLTGPLADQGALHGVLDLLFMLNLPLIRVERCQELDQ